MVLDTLPGQLYRIRLRIQESYYQPIVLRRKVQWKLAQCFHKPPIYLPYTPNTGIHGSCFWSLWKPHLRKTQKLPPSQVDSETLHATWIERWEFFKKSSGYWLPGFSSKLVIQVVQNQCFFFKTALISKNRVKSQFFWGGIENFVEVEVVLEAPVKADELEVTITGEVPIIFRVKQFHQSAGCLEAPLPSAHACLETMAEDSEVAGSEKSQRQGNHGI